MVERTLGITDFRHHLRKNVELVRYKNQRVALARHGEVYAVLVSPEDAEFLKRYRPHGNAGGPSKEEQAVAHVVAEEKARLEREEAARVEAERKAAERRVKLRTHPEGMKIEDVVAFYEETNDDPDLDARDWRFKASFMLKAFGLYEGRQHWSSGFDKWLATSEHVANAGHESERS